MALIGPAEMVLVGAAIVALIFGPKKLPELARSLGESKKEFKKSMKEADDLADEATPDVEGQVEDIKGDQE
ncbi:twin-arginine translocase TatA/TatE family subunit [Candidatus Nanohalobium constans]|uniref:Sec-independent protein translocase protein TatA n=1 Tax=Candidatus Nanohalobium constans TaxID=2565781 RepID=A0A5Q0UFE2_9ARCH|nr:twin-arginine translocase TatA/TatE family subunit [Candidatus Nanohalobium constans]QGA80333.1 sec-independent protein translocase protein TatA [Candidatus Nanohalobium constans]